jgi:hypothetical protein
MFSFMDFPQVPKNLTNFNHPPEVSQWIAHAHQVQYSPIIRNVDIFELQWWVWWTKCQPSWCIGDLRAIADFIVPINADWGIIKWGGLNGLLSVLIALIFWRDSISNDCPNWNHAVDDVLHVLCACV